MNSSHLRSALLKLIVVVILIATGSAVAAIVTAPGPVRYLQIVIDRSPSDGNDVNALKTCATNAITAALNDDNAVVDIGQVSSAPAAMHWTTITDRATILTRLTITERHQNHDRALRQARATIQALLNERDLPPGSSDELASLAAAHTRAIEIAPSIAPNHDTTLLCGDGDFAGTTGSVYRSRLTSTDDARILHRLRDEGLLPDWDGARLEMDPRTVDRWNLAATKDQRIRAFWARWADNSDATYIR